MDLGPGPMIDAMKYSCMQIDLSQHMQRPQDKLHMEDRWIVEDASMDRLRMTDDYIAYDRDMEDVAICAVQWQYKRQRSYMTVIVDLASHRVRKWPSNSGPPCTFSSPFFAWPGEGVTKSTSSVVQHLDNLPPRVINGGLGPT